MTDPKEKIPAGKLPIKLLRRLLKKYVSVDGSVLVGPEIGIDSAVIDFSGGLLLAKTDPITFVAEDIGVYAIHINANDIAVMGGIPRWFLVTMLLPEGKTTEKLVEAIFSQLSRACKEIGVSLCGGHTEITYGIDRPIVVGQMLGVCEKGRFITGADAKPGDDIILTKGVAIEATSIIARAKGEELIKAKIFSRRFIARCRNLLKSPGLSVLKESGLALRSGRVHAMHDPTEGGLLSGLHELAIASRCGLIVERSLIPVIPESRRLLGHFGLDVLGAIASGALIVSLHPEDTGKVLKHLRKEGISSECIGKVTEKKRGVKMRVDGKLVPLPFPERDEITKIF